MEKFDKLVIADEMLESAAQEIYGKWLRIKGGQDFSTMMLDHAAKIFEEPLDRKAIKKRISARKTRLSIWIMNLIVLPS
tara:strand:+ start:444 stop:680 length:237 start_codon:yes stop_codon:yes gene_type:complete